MAECRDRGERVDSLVVPEVVGQGFGQRMP